MANTKSAKKQIKINERNRLRNLYYKTRMKGALKNARQAIINTEVPDEDAAKALREAQRTIYRTASKGVIHKNTASRRYGRLVSLFRKVRVLGLEPAETAPIAVAVEVPESSTFVAESAVPEEAASFAHEDAPEAVQEPTVEIAAEDEQIVDNEQVIETSEIVEEPVSEFHEPEPIASFESGGFSEPEEIASETTESAGSFADAEDKPE